MNEQNSSAHTTPRGGFFRRPEVERRTGLACSTIYILSKNGKFPKQMKIGPRAVGWPVDEILAWEVDPVAWRERVGRNQQAGVEG